MSAASNREASAAARRVPWFVLWRLPFDRRLRRAHRRFKQFPPLPPAPCIMDIGACQGSFTDLALAYWQPGRVWLVEAQPDYEAALRQKYQDNSVCRVIHCAVTSACGTAELRIHHRPGTSSLTACRPESVKYFGLSLREEQRVPVPAQTLDALFAAEKVECVDLMKVDIQGAERQLIQGGSNALRRVANLYIEVMFEERYVGSATFTELHELLRGLGFKLRGLSKGRLGPDGALAYANALYVRPKAGEVLPAIPGGSVRFTGGSSRA
jgi:FkbM family methyltransferase